MDKMPFPYDISFVIHTDYPNAEKDYSRDGTQLNMDCPFCGRARKMNVNLVKNVFSCPACNTQGGLLELHRLAKHLGTRTDAKHDLDRLYGALSDKEKSRLSAYTPVAVEEKTESHRRDVFNLDERNGVQTLFASVLPVNDRFRAELRSEARGSMTDDMIRKLGYASYDPKRTITVHGTELTPAEYAFYDYYAPFSKAPNSYLERAVKYLKKRGSTGIPGFFIDEDDHIRSVSMNDGVFDLLPVRGRHGEISFFQTKFPKLPDNAPQQQKDAYIKYGRYSTSREYGCSTAGLANIHHTWSINYAADRRPKTVFLTEGILKADIADMLLGRPFIALVGISAYSQLADELAYLKRHGTENIVIATDMDYDKNPNVAKSLAAIRGIIKASGLVCLEAGWDHRYKGIDDILIAGQKDPKLKIMMKKN